MMKSISFSPHLTGFEPHLTFNCNYLYIQRPHHSFRNLALRYNWCHPKMPIEVHNLSPFQNKLTKKMIGYILLIIILVCLNSIAEIKHNKINHQFRYSNRSWSVDSLQSFPNRCYTGVFYENKLIEKLSVMMMNQITLKIIKYYHCLRAFRFAREGSSGNFTPFLSKLVNFGCYWLNLLSFLMFLLLNITPWISSSSLW